MENWIIKNIWGLLGFLTGSLSLAWQCFLYQRNKPKLKISLLDEFPSYWIRESDAKDLKVNISSDSKYENRIAVVSLEIQNKRSQPITLTGIKVASTTDDGNPTDHRILPINDLVTFTLPQHPYVVNGNYFIEELRMVKNFKFPIRLNSYDAIRGTFIIILDNSNSDTVTLDLLLNTPYKDTKAKIRLREYVYSFKY